MVLYSNKHTRQQTRTKARALPAVLLTCLLLLGGIACQSSGAGLKPEVIMPYQKDAYRLGILIKDMKIAFQVQSRTPLPYSSNAHAAVWVGTKFPFREAIEIILVSRNYYKDIRYIALSNKRSDGTVEEINHQIFLGGSTETALQLNLAAWTSEDFERLKAVKSKAGFHRLIESKYSRNIPVKTPENKKREKRKK